MQDRRKRMVLDHEAFETRVVPGLGEADFTPVRGAEAEPMNCWVE